MLKAETMIGTSTIDRRWLSVKDAAFYSSLCEKTILRWLSSGKLTRHEPQGGRILVDINELDQVIKGEK